MKHVHLNITIALFLAAVISSVSQADEGVEFFEKHIRPILADHCYQCHSTDADKEGTTEMSSMTS